MARPQASSGLGSGGGTNLTGRDGGRGTNGKGGGTNVTGRDGGRRGDEGRSRAD
jgi:hypothetical protein